MNRRRWLILGAAAVVLAVGGAFALYWFQPWKLVVDDPVDEVLSSPAPAAVASAQIQVLASGTFVTHEHETSGTVRIIALPDGARRLEIIGLDTSNGPDLRVWLTDQPVIEGRDGWFLFDDGTYAELGRLKGNKGDQGYDIPADLNINEFRSVSIWCKRFSVSFGAAALGAA